MILLIDNYDSFTYKKSKKPYETVKSDFIGFLRFRNI